MKTNGDDIISPTVETAPQGGTYVSNNGLTKREYFAAIAMQGLLVNSTNGNRRAFENLTEEAVMYADGLIERLNE